MDDAKCIGMQFECVLVCWTVLIYCRLGPCCGPSVYASVFAGIPGFGKGVNGNISRSQSDSCLGGPIHSPMATWNDPIHSEYVSFK